MVVNEEHLRQSSDPVRHPATQPPRLRPLTSLRDPSNGAKGAPLFSYSYKTLFPQPISFDIDAKTPGVCHPIRAASRTLAARPLATLEVTRAK
jgi:hypothetical protein